MGLLRGEPRKGSTSSTARQKKRKTEKRQEGSFRDIRASMEKIKKRI